MHGKGGTAPFKQVLRIFHALLIVQAHKHLHAGRTLNHGPCVIKYAGCIKLDQDNVIDPYICDCSVTDASSCLQALVLGDC